MRHSQTLINKMPSYQDLIPTTRTKLFIKHQTNLINSKDESPDLSPKFLLASSYLTNNTYVKEFLINCEHLYFAEKYEECIDLYKKILVSDRKCGPAIVNIAAVYIQKKMFKTALEILLVASFKQSEFLAGNFNKAIAFIMLKQYENAIETLDKIKNITDADLKKRTFTIKNYLKTHKNPQVPLIQKKNKKKSLKFHFPYLDSNENPLENKSKTQSSTNLLKTTNETLPDSISVHKSLNLFNVPPKPLKIISTAYKNFTRNLKNSQEKRQKSDDLPKKEEIPEKQKNDKNELTNSEYFMYLPDERKITEGIIDKQLTTQAIKEIIYEYSKPLSYKNVNHLASRLKKLHFFSKFSDGIIAEIVKKSFLLKFDKGETIITQGEDGDCMYIVLTGSVAVIKKSEDFGNLEVQVNSLYQGESFGEMALLSGDGEESSKRSASCICEENTLVIGIQKADYKFILLEMMQNDIHGKAAFFSGLNIFRNNDKYSLIPLAANIEPLNFTLNQVILEAGELPQGLYIIYSGRCTVN